MWLDQANWTMEEDEKNLINETTKGNKQAGSQQMERKVLNGELRRPRGIELELLFVSNIPEPCEHRGREGCRFLLHPTTAFTCCETAGLTRQISANFISELRSLAPFDSQHPSLLGLISGRRHGFGRRRPMRPRRSAG